MIAESSSHICRLLLGFVFLGWTGCRSIGEPRPGDSQKAAVGSESGSAAPVRYRLKAAAYWRLSPPHHERFDASGLLLTPQGKLWTVSDRGASLYEIDLAEGNEAAGLSLLTNLFTASQLAPLDPEKADRYDVEGIARDSSGRIYLCEEANRWILRWDPETDHVRRLPIDWAPVEKYFSRSDRNASFEGVAVGDSHLYVANEREIGRVITVDLKAFKVVDDFQVRPWGNEAQDTHYSDLCWFDHALYVLLRSARMVLKVEPGTHRVLAEYDFSDMEKSSRVAYLYTWLTGTMEGLAVDRDAIWLVTDNNGVGRLRNPEDSRPTLFKCLRPDRD